MEKQCRDCEWYDPRRRPDAGLLSPRAPYCVALGFYLFGNHAPDCKMYRPRPAVTSKPYGD